MAGVKKQAEFGRGPRLLVIDGSYTFDTIKGLGLEQSVLSRDLDGYFEHVWSAHPFGDLANARLASGLPETYELAERHTFVQAKAGKFRWLGRALSLNFLLGQIALVLSLRRLVRREGINLIRAGDPLYVGLLGWIVARLTGRTFMIRVNANNDKIRQSTGRPIYPRLLRSIAIEKWIERLVLPRADLVVAPNQDNVDFAVANGARSECAAIFRYGNLLSPAHLEAPAARGLDEDVFRRLGVEPGKFLLCVSRLQDLKFPDDAVRALVLVRAKGHEVKLLLAGEGPMRLELEALAAELGVSGHVLFAGNIDQHALSQIYAHAGVVVSPLTGRALSEAALGGAPIVAYDLDWQGDVIENGVTGELVPFRDVDALGKAAAKLLEDAVYARRIGEAVRARALDMLDPEKLNAHERATYANLLGKTL